MGLQQILYVVLTVIVVGVAIAVGVTMFGGRAYAENKSALATEINNYASQAIQYWRMPLSMGGASMDANNINLAALALFLGFQNTGGENAVYSIKSDNGEYRIMGINGTNLIIHGLGKEEKSGKHPLAKTTINISTSAITTAFADTTGF